MLLLLGSSSILATHNFHGWNAKADVALPGWCGNEQTADVVGTTGRRMHLLTGLLTPAEISALHAAALRCTAYDCEQPDTVDQAATFQANVFEAGTESEGAAEVAHALAPIIEERLLPYIRTKFRCPTACVADALLRRYRPGERTELNLHYDVQAFATVIIPISAQLPVDADEKADCGGLTAYSGGLFVQGGAARSSRRFVRFASAGDALVHQFDLMHGVEVSSGERYAIALWFSDSPSSRAIGAAPWVLRAAEDGNADAQFLMATFCAQGRFGTKRDEAAAAEWLERGAAQGHAVSLLGLARHRLGEGLMEEAARHFRAAADHGHVEAQYSLALCYLDGMGLERDVESARAWFGRAAAQGGEFGDAAALELQEL